MTTINPNAARRAFERVLIALDKLQESDIPAHAVLYSGPRAVVVVDKPPKFVKGALKMRQMVGGMLQATYAAPFHGVQLQWHVNTEILHEAGHA